MAMSTLMVVVLNMITAKYSLKLANEKALEAMDMNPYYYARAYKIVEITGLPGFGTLSGCLGLGMAFLTVACGIAMASAGAVFIAKKQIGPSLETAFTGLTLSMGCGVGGALLGSTSSALLTLELRGLFFMGLILCLSPGILVALQKKNTKAGLVLSPTTTMLCFLTLTFLTMLLGVWLGMTVAGYDVDDPGKTVIPSLFLVALILLPGGCIVDTMAVMTISKQLNFGLLVTVTGLLLGFGMGVQSTATVQFHDIFFTLPTVVYIVEVLAGVVGASLGAMSVQSLAADTTAKELSMWISLPAVVVLYNVTMDIPNTGLIQLYLGVGGELGLMLGLTAASGFALGCIVAITGYTVWLYAILVFCVECGYSVILCEDSLLSFKNVVTSMVLIITPVLIDKNTEPACRRPNTTLLLNDALNSAALGVVMTGATMLGAGGLLTAALGSAGSAGIVVAMLITLMNTFIYLMDIYDVK